MNINSLLPKLDELWEIIKISNPTVIGITETNIDHSICDSEISVDWCCAIRRDRKRRGGGIVCYVTSNICCNTRNCISNEIENIFIELLSKSKTNYRKISIRDKLFKKCKSIRLNIDRETYKKARNDVQRTIKLKKNVFWEETVKKYNWTKRTLANVKITRVIKQKEFSMEYNYV